YSGAANYQTTIQLQKPKEGQRVYLNMGSVIALAKVRINGKDAGGAWTPPYKIDITSAVQEGKNQLEIKVVNTWVNRLIGDLGIPQDKRTTWLPINPYRRDSPLHPAGLLGPVTIETYAY